MGTLVNAVMRAEPGKSGTFNAKQDKARELARAMLQLPAFKVDTAPVVVEQAGA